MKVPPHNRIFPQIALTAAALFLGACSRDRVTAYRVHRDPPVAPVMTAAAASTAPSGEPGTPFAEAANVATDGLSWTVPAGWKTGPSSTMRRGSYLVPAPDGDADLSITAFGGDAGGVLANVNRWRSQLQLPELSADQLTGNVTQESINGLSFTLVDFASTAADAQRMVGAIVPVGADTWFFKLSGTGSVVGAAKPAFLQFVETVHPASTAAAPLPAADTGPGFAEASTVSSGQLRWTVPAGWRNGPTSTMRRGSYFVPAAGGEADLSITSLGGDAGGLLANVNRWRSQLQLPELSADAVAASVVKESINGLPFTLVDFASSGANAQRTVGAIVPVGGDTWFFKLSGSDAVVAAAKQSFLEFVRTVRPATT